MCTYILPILVSNKLCAYKEVLLITDRSNFSMQSL